MCEKALSLVICFSISYSLFVLLVSLLPLPPYYTDCMLFSFVLSLCVSVILDFLVLTHFCALTDFDFGYASSWISCV